MTTDVIPVLPHFPVMIIKNMRIEPKSSERQSAPSLSSAGGEGQGEEAGYRRKAQVELRESNLNSPRTFEPSKVQTPAPLGTFRALHDKTRFYTLLHANLRGGRGVPLPPNLNLNPLQRSGRSLLLVIHFALDRPSHAHFLNPLSFSVFGICFCSNKGANVPV
jgi:hypothetical protein